MPQDTPTVPPSGLFNQVKSVVRSAATFLTTPTHGPADLPSPFGPSYTSSLLAPIPPEDGSEGRMHHAQPHLGGSRLPPTQGSQLGARSHGHNGPERHPTSSGKGKGREDSFGRDAGWEPNAGGFSRQSGDRGANQVSKLHGGIPSVYDGPSMEPAKANADKAQRMLADLDQGRSSRPFYDSGGNGGEFDEIEVTGESTRSHLQSSSSRLPHQSGSSAAARARTDWGGKPHAIAVPNNGRYGGASAHKGYSTQSDSYTMQPQRPAPLRGTKGQSAFVSISTANLKAAEAAEIRAADLARVQEETRKQELARHKTEKTQKARKNTLNHKRSSVVLTPPSGQVASSPSQRSPYFSNADGLPSSSRNGGSLYSAGSKLRPSGGQPAPTPTRPSSKGGPEGDSRRFAVEGEPALMAPPLKSHPNREALPPPAVALAAKKEHPTAPLPLSFKKKTTIPVEPAPKEKVNALKQRRMSNGQQQQPVVIDDSGDEACPTMSQGTEDIDEYPVDTGTSSQQPPPALKPASAVKVPVKTLLDARPPANLNPLPMSQSTMRNFAVSDDSPPIPIFVPKEGSVRRKSVVGGMAGSKGGLIQTSLPTAMTRGQNRQLAGGTVLTFPKCKVYYDGKPSRQCILSFWAEKLVIENVSRGADLAAIPLSDVKELLYSERHDEKYSVLHVQLESHRLPPELDVFRTMTFVWMFPHEEGSKLDSTWVKMLQLPQLTAAQPVGGKMEPPPSLRPLNKSSTTKLLTSLESTPSASGSKKAPASRIRPIVTRALAVASQGPIAIDDSDEEDVDFPDMKPTLAAAPRSGVGRGKQRETGASAKAGPPREAPPANPHELMCNWPATGRPEISILKGDYYRLTHKDEYLNDTIIDWGLKRSFAREKLTKPNLEDDVYIFSSFLYSKLTEPNILKSKKDPWESVRSWTTKKVEGKKEKELKIDLFKKKYIIVPINESYHWYLAIIVNPAAVLQPPPPKTLPPRKPVLPSMATTTRAATAPPADPMDVDSESELLVVESRSTSPQKTTEEVLDEAAAAGAAEGPTDVGGATSITEGTLTDGIKTPPTLDEVGEDDAPERKQGYIFILDSLGNATVKPAAVLSKYLRSEGVEHQGWAADAEATVLTADKVDVPRQADESSCGVYLIHYAEVFMRDPEKAVDFMLHTRKPKRSSAGTAPYKDLLSQYENERDAFWTVSELACKRESYRQALLALEEAYHENERAKAAQRDSSADAKSDIPDSSPVEQAADPSETFTTDDRAAAAPSSQVAPPVAEGPDPAPPADHSIQRPEHAVVRSTSPFFSPATPPGKEMTSRSPEHRISPPFHDDGSPAFADPLDLTLLRGSLPARSSAGSPDVDDSYELASHVSATPENVAQALALVHRSNIEGPSPVQASGQAPSPAQPSEEKVARQFQATPSSSASSDVITGVLKVPRIPSPPLEVPDSSDDELNLLKDDEVQHQRPSNKRRNLSPASSGSGGRLRAKRLKGSSPSASVTPAVLRFSAPDQRRPPPATSPPLAKRPRYEAVLEPQSQVPPKRKDGSQARKTGRSNAETVELFDSEDGNSDDSSVRTVKGGGDSGRRRKSEEI